MIFHVDANSFYASCERIFRPDLEGKAIAVLSNNDEIIIALNRECKNQGFKRGDRYCEVKNLFRAKDVRVFSSNYTLYADISSRLNRVYGEFSEQVEIYSIDESFLFLPDYGNSFYMETACRIQSRIFQEIHIPVSIGVAPTKTLAKLCNKLAKQNTGIFIWDKVAGIEVLKNCPVKDIWGIGLQRALVLHRNRIYTAGDLINQPLDKVKKLLTVSGITTWQELRGIPGQINGGFFVKREKHKNITCSKSFGKKTEALVSLEAALADFTVTAFLRMKREGQKCGGLGVYITTGKNFVDGVEMPPYRCFEKTVFSFPADYFPFILNSALGILRKIYRPGFRYKKVMVILLDLQDSKEGNLLFEDREKIEKKEKENSLMGVFDALNAKYGRGTLAMGVNMLNYSGGRTVMRRDFLSPEYTTDINQIPSVY